jgi:hypothetical protein
MAPATVQARRRRSGARCPRRRQAWPDPPPPGLAAVAQFHRLGSLWCGIGDSSICAVTDAGGIWIPRRRARLPSNMLCRPPQMRAGRFQRGRAAPSAGHGRYGAGVRRAPGCCRRPRPAGGGASSPTSLLPLLQAPLIGERRPDLVRQPTAAPQRSRDLVAGGGAPGVSRSTSGPHRPGRAYDGRGSSVAHRWTDGPAGPGCSKVQNRCQQRRRRPARYRPLGGTFRDSAARLLPHLPVPVRVVFRDDGSWAWSCPWHHRSAGTTGGSAADRPHSREIDALGLGPQAAPDCACAAILHKLSLLGRLLLLICTCTTEIRHRRSPPGNILVTNDPRRQPAAPRLRLLDPPAGCLRDQAREVPLGHTQNPRRILTRHRPLPARGSLPGGLIRSARLRISPATTSVSIGGRLFPVSGSSCRAFDPAKIDRRGSAVGQDWVGWSGPTAACSVTTSAGSSGGARSVIYLRPRLRARTGLAGAELLRRLPRPADRSPPASGQDAAGSDNLPSSSRSVPCTPLVVSRPVPMELDAVLLDIQDPRQSARESLPVPSTPPPVPVRVPRGQAAR